MKKSKIQFCSQRAGRIAEHLMGCVRYPTAYSSVSAHILNETKSTKSAEWTLLLLAAMYWSIFFQHNGVDQFFLVEYFHFLSFIFCTLISQRNDTLNLQTMRCEQRRCPKSSWEFSWMLEKTKEGKKKNNGFRTDDPLKLKIWRCALGTWKRSYIVPVKRNDKIPETIHMDLSHLNATSPVSIHSEKNL